VSANAGGTGDEPRRRFVPSSPRTPSQSRNPRKSLGGTDVGKIQEIYKGRIVDFRLEEVSLPNGATVTLEVIRHPGAAAIVAVDGDGQVTLVHQYRHAAGGFLWEIPAGTLESGELPLTCARRELQEEAGLVAEELVLLGSVLTVPGFCDERIHLFLARRLTAAPQQLDHDEVLTVSRVPLARALEMVRSGTIQDAKTIAGLHHAVAYLRDEAHAPRAL
jgi:ADP-ribose pyrophosphatase